MPINIHGNQYVTVTERLQAVHKDHKQLTITTELVDRDPIVIKATVITEKGTYTGYSAANPNKSIEKVSPYEVAETSAVGRALGFAGYGIDEAVASAEEVAKAIVQERPSTNSKQADEHICEYHKVKMFKTANMKNYAHRDEVRGWCNGSGYQDEKDSWKKHTAASVAEDVAAAIN